MTDGELPASWATSCLSEVASSAGGGTPSTTDSSNWVGGTIPWVSPKDMKTFHIRGSVDRVTEKALGRLTLVPTGSVLVVVRSGILSHTLPVAMTALPVTVNQDMRAFIPKAGIDPSYLAWQLVSQGRDILDACSKDGTTVASIEGARLAAYPLAIAPVVEQKRIVDKLDELFAELDAGVAELQAAQKKLAQYRQSLLKAAVEGALTADWRAAHPPQESGEALLARILQERRACWETRQLDKFKAQGKTPPKGWQSKYPEPVAPDVSALHGLPDGWRWVSLDMLGEIASGVAKGSKTHDGEVLREVPYLRVANVQRGYLDMSVVKTILAPERDIEELALRLGDVLFNEGGDRDKLGRGWVWQGELPECIHQNHVFRLRPLCADVVPEFISHHGNTFGQKWFQSAGKQTTNLASINLGMLRLFPVPLAPADEQREIARLVAKELETISAQEAAVEHGLRMAAAQRQNILRAAFSGQLVPQDPADEPASALLARIRTERAATTAAPKAARRTRLSA